MDKETLSNYGWIVICTLVLAVMIALATPFGEYIKAGVWSTTNGLNDTLNKNMEIAGLYNDFGYSHEGEIPEGGIYQNPDGDEYDEKDPFPETQDGDTYVYGNYKYTMVASDTGWWARAIKSDVADTVYSSPLTTINGYNVINLVGAFGGFKTPFKLADDFKIPKTVTRCQRMFANAEGLTELPDNFVIPDNVEMAFGMFEKCINLKKLPNNFRFNKNITDLHWFFKDCRSLQELPDGLTFENTSVDNLVGAFSHCTSLKTLPESFKLPQTENCTIQGMFAECTSLEKLPDNFVIPSTVCSMYCTFKDCTNLSDTITINAAPGSYSECFAGTVQPIIITGSSPTLQEIAATATNGNVTVK